MAKYSVHLKDRQTGKKTQVSIDAKNSQEAKQIAMKEYGHSYEIL